MASKKDEQTEQVEQVAPGYVITMQRAKQTLHPIPDKDGNPLPEFFITAQHPGMGEDDIVAASVPIEYEARAAGSGGQAKMMASITSAAGFVEKCIQQIMDFRLPVQERSGKMVNRKHDPRDAGKNQSNREVYQSLIWMTLPIAAFNSMSLREIIEQFLDSVAGRSPEVTKDFDELKNELSQLVSDS